MITVTHFTASDLMKCNQPESFLFDGSIGDYIADTFFTEETPFMVFEGEAALENDITHNIERMIAAKEGSFIVTETAGEAFTTQIIVSIVLSVAVLVLTPRPELPQNVNRQQQSPNNALSSRSNTARPLQRIPDIKGSVLSIPDIIAPTYSTYAANEEIEHGFYCVGRKQIQVEDVKDGETPITLIEGASAGIYYPNNSPNNSAPNVSINEHESEPVVAAYRSNQVDGVTLTPDFEDSFIDATTIAFFDNSTTPSVPPDAIRLVNNLFPASFVWPSGYAEGADIIFTDLFINGIDISGTYTITDRFNDHVIQVSAPSYSAGTDVGESGNITTAVAKEYTDWAYSTAIEFNSAIINVIAPDGLYIDTGATTLSERSIDYEIQLEGVNAAGEPDGNVIVLTETMAARSNLLIGNTTRYEFAAPTRFRQRAKRITARYNGSGTAVDTIKLEDVYGIKNIDELDFGNVTTIQTITKATPFATSAKERQLNVKATELLNVYEGAGVFSNSLTPNKRAVQSFINDAIDPVIGNMALDEIDADAILALDSEINDYFENIQLGEFSYTFDSTDITFQDYSQIIFNAINCIAFRESGKISALFEKPAISPSMLFTHRSKKPNSETYTRNFNQATINDGIEFNYVDPENGITETLFFPEDKSAVNPKKFDIAGIRNISQAIIRAKREFNKLKFKKLNADVVVTAEGRFIKPNDMIAIVKGSRVRTFDGEVLAQNGLELTLSADVEFTPLDAHTITLKQEDGSVQNIVVTEGSSTDKVVLANFPVQAIRTGIDSRRTEFSFSNEAKQEAEKWLVQEVDISDKWFVNVKAINYSEQYYDDDLISVNAFSNGFSNGFG